MKVIKKLIGFIFSLALMAGILVAIDQLAINPTADKTAAKFERFEGTTAAIDPVPSELTAAILTFIQDSGEVKSIVVVTDTSSLMPKFAFIIYYNSIPDAFTARTELKEKTGDTFERVTWRGKTVFLGSKSAERDYREIIF
ncbi:MAG: hypothetical protein LBT55_04600 [Clostridiaceae bacterium]|jgi:hypothetical protein|nr:hypothetical protein [Clostridiaceae bacterium]